MLTWVQIVLGLDQVLNILVAICHSGASPELLQYEPCAHEYRRRRHETTCWAYEQNDSHQNINAMNDAQDIKNPSNVWNRLWRCGIIVIPSKCCKIFHWHERSAMKRSLWLPSVLRSAFVFPLKTLPGNPRKPSVSNGDEEFDFARSEGDSFCVCHQIWIYLLQFVVDSARLLYSGIFGIGVYLSRIYRTGP